MKKGRTKGAASRGGNSFGTVWQQRLVSGAAVMASTVHGQAARNRNHLAGNEPCVVRRQEADDARVIRRLRKTLHRNRPLETFGDLLTGLALGNLSEQRRIVLAFLALPGARRSVGGLTKPIS